MSLVLKYLLRYPSSVSVHTDISFTEAQKENINQVHHYLYTQGNLTDIDHVEILEYPQFLHVCESLHLHPASRFGSSPLNRLWLI